MDNEIKLLIEDLKSRPIIQLGVQICERKIISHIIKYAEPSQSLIITPPIFDKKDQQLYPEVDAVVATVYEVENTIRNYRFISYFSIYLGIIFLPFIAYLVAKLFEIISLVWIAPSWVVLIITVASEIVYLAIWLGIYLPIKERQDEWEETMKREKILEKIEHFAVTTSSTIIAGILVDIEKLKETQKTETAKVKKISKKRSLIEEEVMQKFDEMITEREKRYKKRENVKTILSWTIGFLLGYFGERTLDSLFVGITDKTQQ